MPDGTLLRCSAVVIRRQDVLLLHRIAGLGDCDGGQRTVDIVFYAAGLAADAVPREQEPGLEPVFVPLDEIHDLDLRPPLAGHLRRTARYGGRLYAPYLANLWRPAGAPGP